MSVTSEFRLALVARLAATLPQVQVVGYPPGEKQAIKESIWFEREETAFEWRSLGTAEQLLRNRSEEVEITLRAHVYREAPDAGTACLAALARADELLEAIEEAIAAAPDVTNTVAFARLARWTADPIPRESGWSVDCRAFIEATNYP